jgi:alkylhydroperoxidase family enzyme
LQLARRVVALRGHVTDADLAAAKRAGYDDAGIGEIVANVAVNVFTNSFNSVAATDIDFPVVTAHAARQAA